MGLWTPVVIFVLDWPESDSPLELKTWVGIVGDRRESNACLARHVCLDAGPRNVIQFQWSRASFCNESATLNTECWTCLLRGLTSLNARLMSNMISTRVL